MATYAIGDIHGEIGALETLLDEDLFDAQDTIVFLGDYVDRGPNVKGVIELLLSLSQHRNTVFLMGNHEIMMLESRKNVDLLPQWLFSGGDATLDSYQIGDRPDWHNQIPDRHWQFLETGQSFYEKDAFIFVHAGLQAGVSLKDQNRHHLFWKKCINPSPYAPDKKVICGHTSQKNGLIADFGHTICIDTFAWGGQWLTCLEVESGQYWQSRKNGKVRKGRLNQ